MIIGPDPGRLSGAAADIKRHVDGTFMRIVRLAFRMTQAQFAELVGCDRNTLARYERGELVIPMTMALATILLFASMHTIACWRGYRRGVVTMAEVERSLDYLSEGPIFTTDRSKKRRKKGARR